MQYLYSKDICGFEVCERFESEKELQKYCSENLPENWDHTLVGVVRPGDAPDTWTADEDSTPNKRAIAACVEQAEKDGMQRPFWFVCIACTGDCEYEAIQNKEDVDFYSLYKAWEDLGAYKVALRRYASGEITPVEANAMGMYLLAKYIREDGTNNEYKENYDDANE